MTNTTSEFDRLRLVVERLSAVVEEQKVRRVRTPEGAQRYGQPIGSIIAPDVMPNISGGRVTKRLFPEFKFKRSTEGKLKVLSCTDKKHGTTARVVTASGRITLEMYDRDGTRIPSTPYGGQKGFSARDVTAIPDTPQNRDLLMRRAHFMLKMPYIADAVAESKRKPRKTKGVADEWWGTYGVDWQHDDESGPIIDPNDPDQRFALAKIVASELGIKYIHNEGTAQEIHFESIETINTLVAALDEIVPGMSAYVPVYGMDATTGSLAWCTTVSASDGTSSIWGPGRPGSGSFYLGDGFEYPHAAIGLSYKMFADGWDVNEVKRIHWGAKGSSWWSVDPDVLAKQNGWEDWQALIVSTVTHEIGHMVGYVGIGELGSTRDEDRRQQISDKFKIGLSEIFADFGLLTPDEELSDEEFSRFTSRSRNLRSSTFGAAGIDRASMTYVLSEYGSVNMHELCAEVWAEYMLSDKPRPFAQAVGELLENCLREFIDYEYGEID